MSIVLKNTMVSNRAFSAVATAAPRRRVHGRICTRQFCSSVKNEKNLPTNPSAQPSNTAFFVSMMGASAAIIAVVFNPSFSRAEHKKSSHRENHKLEVNLMDKIAEKPYLSYNSVPSEYPAPSRRFQRGGGGGEASRAKSYGIDTSATPRRPKGVPSRLRLLTIDVPHFKTEAFDHGMCVKPSELFDIQDPQFVDGVAPPKRPEKQQHSHSGSHSGKRGRRSSNKPIVQKSLAKELYYCYDSRWKQQRQKQQQQELQIQMEMQQSKQSNNSSHDSEQSSSSSTQQTKIHPKVGVEIVEASVSGLNPKNIRRTYTSRSRAWVKKSYDPGKKYASSSSGTTATASSLSSSTTQSNSEDDESGVADVEEAEVEEEELEKHKVVLKDNDSDNLDDAEDGIDSDDYEFDSILSLAEDKLDAYRDERDAPWNQYAWLEEMHLRINGLVPFGEPMKKAHPLSHWIYGRIYGQTVPASSTFNGWFSWWWPWMWIASSGVSGKYSGDGVDGEGESPLYGDTSNQDGSSRRRSFMSWLSLSSIRAKNNASLNRASNKPHAVIVDGAAMQRVPGSLRFLTKTCREANVPLYILNDPRSCGSNTHSNLSDALVDIRKTIPANIVRNALDLREGSAFERGRMVGRWEKEVAWQTWDAGRKTREAWKDAKERWRREREEDWSELSKDEIRKKLLDRKVIIIDETVRGEQYTDGFLDFCQECVKEQKRKQATSNRNAE